MDTFLVRLGESVDKVSTARSQEVGGYYYSGYSSCMGYGA